MAIGFTWILMVFDKMGLVRSCDHYLCANLAGLENI
jgi:hypothetical protein